MKISKLVRRSVVMTAFIGLVACCYSFGMIFRGMVITSAARMEPTLAALANPVPAIVLGMGQKPLFDRGDLAVRLWQKGYVSHFVTAGGQGPGEIEPESLTLANILLTGGVPANAISQDQTSRNTLQNLQNAKSILKQLGLTQLPVLVVTHHYHGQRAGEIARRLGLSAVSVTTDGPRLDRRFYRYTRETASYLRWSLLQAPFVDPAQQQTLP